MLLPWYVLIHGDTLAVAVALWLPSHTPSEHHRNRIVTREQHRRMADMTDEEEPEHQYRHNIYQTFHISHS